MSAITTHVLDTAIGRPAAGVPVVLERVDVQGTWHIMGRSATDADGRVLDFAGTAVPFEAGVYRLVFETASYFARRQVRAFYPMVAVTFSVTDGDAHYHVPLLVSPYGYSTYRGS